MSDGSNMGISAERAIETILGGEPSPDDEEKQTPEEARARIEAATPGTYGGCADCICRAVLRLFEQRPETCVWPTDPEYAWTLPDGTKLTDEEARERGLWSGEFPRHSSGAEYKQYGPRLSDAVKEVMTDEERQAYNDCTGFQFGFAVNQARWIYVAYNPTAMAKYGPNPAILHVEPRT